MPQVVKEWIVGGLTSVELQQIRSSLGCDDITKLSLHTNHTQPSPWRRITQLLCLVPFLCKSTDNNRELRESDGYISEQSFIFILYKLDEGREIKQRLMCTTEITRDRLIKCACFLRSVQVILN